MSEKAQSKWIALKSAPWWPAVPVLVIQLVSGIWYLPRLSFFWYLSRGAARPDTSPHLDARLSGSSGGDGRGHRIGCIE